LRIVRNSIDSMSDNKLFFDYVNSYDKVKSFYQADFREEGSWQDIIGRITSRKRYYNELAGVLRRQNSNLKTSSMAMENIDSMASNSAFAVVTGQQVGAFTGPLYTIYKALTAIDLSRKLSRKFGVKFIPVFWMESNDHDLAEANHINILDQESNLLRLEYISKGYVPGSSMKDVLIDDGFREFSRKLMDRFPDTEFKPDVFHLIDSSYQNSGSENLTQGFGQMMSKLLGEFGLVLLDPSDPDLKKLMKPIFEKNIHNPLEPMAIVNCAGEKLKKAGYESQIEKSLDSTGLFLEKDKIRHKLFYRNGFFIMDEKAEKLNHSEIMEILNSEPWRFSPNVAIRPIIQDYLLPTAAYVAGPGEICYFAQLRELYHFFDVNMPVIYPRASITIVENKIQRIIDKNNLSIGDLSENYEKVFSRISKNTAAAKLGEILETSKSEIDQTFHKLTVKLNEFDPNMRNFVESTRKKIDYQINILGERAYKIQRDRDDILKDQIKRSCMNIFPEGKPQERVFNIIQYFVLYGLNFIDDLMSVIIGGNG